MNLEAELRALEIDWPETPAFALRTRRRRWPFAAALVAAALAAAFAVPQSRGAILRFFHLGSARIAVVDTLPPARDETSLTAGLGDVIPLRAARRAIPQLLVPPVDPPPPLHYAPGNVVSVVFESGGSPVLLSELSQGNLYFKKLVSGESRVEGVQVGADPGFWLAAPRHVVVFPRRSPRLAGPVLLWVHLGTTYRLEGPNLRKEEGIRIALSLRRG